MWETFAPHRHPAFSSIPILACVSIDLCELSRALQAVLLLGWYQILLLIYLTCIRPHLEYACQLWDPSTNKNRHLLEDVQKFACRVCLKRWDLDYDSMLQLLSIPPLTIWREYLKLTTTYNIIHGHWHFPSGLFVHSNFPYSSNRSLDHLHIQITCIIHLSLLVCGITCLTLLKPCLPSLLLKGLYFIIFTIQAHVRH